MGRTNFFFQGKAILAGLAFALLLHAAEAQTLVVNSTADDGNGSCTPTKCTLRDAVLNLHSAIPTEEITFSLPANSTIVLTSGTLTINYNVIIKGPGASSLTIARSSTVAHFRILDIPVATVDISGVTIANGIDDLAESAGAIHNAGTLSLTGCTISGNTGTSEGGAIFNSRNLTINNCTISGNTAAFRGGGVCNTGNSNSGSSAVATITNSTISNNNAGAIGGGIENGGPFFPSKLTIINCTFSGNTANNGGAIQNNSSDTTVGVTIANSTISGNTTTGTNNSGAGISNGGTCKLMSTIVAKNTATLAPDVYNTGTITSQGYNLIGNNQNTGMAATTGDQIGTPGAPIDPLLGPLQDNGGPTQTQALGVNSPAIDKGNSGGITTDQRGFTRTVDTPSITNAGDGTDVGAYEVQADQLQGCPSVIVTNLNDTGTGSLRFVIAGACGGSSISFADIVRGAINLTSGELVLSKNMTIKGPGANLLTVQRSSAPGTTNFRVFHMNGNTSNGISGLTIANGNVPGNLGGGISNDNGTLALTNVMLTGNAADIGAGLYNGRTATVIGSTFYANTITGNNPGIGGAGIYNAGSLTVTNSTISGNIAHATGGGDRGAGILNNLGTVTLDSCTIANNSADSGGGVMNTNNGTVTSRSTIIALNTSPNGPDFNGALRLNEYNLLGNSSQTTYVGQNADDQIGTPASPIDPLLGPLQDNGGPTLTLALRSGSPALDKGAPDLSTDQRGLPRPSDDPAISNAIGGDGSDIGAFELQVATPTPTPTPTPTATPTATPGLVGNVSTRLLVGADDNALIEGFIVQGPSGSTKKIIVRAIGPSLIPFGIADALANPTLEIHDSNNNTIATNDDWRNTQIGGIITADQSAEISGSGLAPSNDLESAIIANLVPGNYTAVVRGAGNTTGTGVVDAYDLSGSSPTRLANIATRGLIQPGDKLMIAGFIIQNGSVRVVVSAIGPSLQAFGITNALPDTTLELRNANGTFVMQNDDWKTNQQAELQATGLQPSNDKEAAIVATLPPDQYSALVRGKPEATGIGVVQVFFLQN